MKKLFNAGWKAKCSVITDHFLPLKRRIKSLATLTFKHIVK